MKNGITLSRGVRSYARPILALIGAAALTASASAATSTWSGAGTWSTGANWAPLAPVTFDTIVFGGAGGTFVQADVTDLYYRLNLSGASYVFFGNNNQLLLGQDGLGGTSGGITVSSAHNMQFLGTNGFVLAQAQEWDVTAASGALTINWTVDLSSFALTLDTVANSTISLGNTVSGGGSLLVSGSGTTRLISNNTYTGGTTLSGGTLSLGTNTALGTGDFTYTAGTLLSSNSVTLSNALDIVGSSMTIGNGSDLTFGGTTTLNQASTTLTVNNTSGTTTFSGAIGEDASIGSPAGLTKAGSGALRFNGASSNTYTGTTTVNAGTLILAKSSGTAVPNDLTLADVAGVAVQLNSSDQISDVADITVGTQATFNLNGNTERVGSIAGSGTVALGEGGDLTVGNTNNTIFSGSITGAGGTLTKVGSGTFTVQGSNSYSGGTTLRAGRLAMNNAGGLGTGTITFDSTDTPTLQTNAALSISNAMNLLSGVGTINSNGFDSTLSGDISGAGGLTKIGSGTLTLSGSNTFSGGLRVNAGTVAASDSASLGTGLVTLDSGTMQFLDDSSFDNSFRVESGDGIFDTANTVSMTGSINGPGNVAFEGGGRFNLLGTGSYTGDTEISDGTTVALQANSALPSTTNVSIDSMSTLAVGTSTATVNDLASTGTLTNNGGTLNVTNAITLIGGASISGSGTFAAKIVASSTSTSITASGGPLNLGSASKAGAWDFDGTLNTGNNLVTISTADNQVAVTGTVNMAGSSADTPTLATNGKTINVAAGEKIAGIGTIQGNVKVNANAQAGLEATGDGIAVTGNLSGTGNTTGAVAVQGNYTPYDGAAAITSVSHGDLDLSEANQTNVVVGNGGSSTLVSVLSVIAGGTLKVNAISGWNPTLGEFFNLFDIDGGEGIQGTFDSLDLPSLASFGDGSWTWDTGQLYSTGRAQIVPEPSTYAMILGGLLLGLTFWRRRRANRK